MPESDDNGITELRAATADLRSAISFVRDQRGNWQMPQYQLPAAAESWNFTTFEKYINQRFTDLALQLRERYEAQQTGVTAALAAAEKAVNAALIAAEKAVDKAEGAQQLRNEAQNEFRKSLSDLSGLMWTIKEGSLAVDSIRREFTASITGTENRIVEITSASNTMRTAIDNRITEVVNSRVEATDILRRSVEGRIKELETGFANLHGRIWAISAVFALVALLASVGFKFVTSAPVVQPTTSYVPAPTAAPSSAPAPTAAPSSAPAPITVPR